MSAPPALTVDVVTIFPDYLAPLRLSLPGRAFFHAGVSSTFGTGSELTVALEARNLFDARVEDFVGYPLPGRAVYVSVSGAFEPGRKTP